MKDETNIMNEASLNIPKEYIFCFQSDCPKAAECIRHFAGQHIDDRPLSTTVQPGARKHGECKWYKEARTMQGAWGFNTLFSEAKAKDAPTLRQAIKNYLGGNGTYYRYQHGEMLLSPEQQEWILSLFKRYGYTDGLVFDGYQNMIDW